MGRFNGAVLVARGDELIYAKGFGFANLEWGVPNTAETKFDIGSISKQFTTALVFLLAGPATNAATMTLVARYLGRGALVIYLVCIAVVAVAMGLVLDFLYGLFDITAQAAVGKHAGMLPTPFKIAAAAVLVVLGLYVFLRARLPRKETSPSTSEEQHADTCH